MAKQRKARKPRRPTRTTEPTTHQLRQEYYRRRADQQALVDLGLKLDERPSPKGDAGFWADTRDALDRLEVVHAVWRWAGLTGAVPEPEDWDPNEGWPSADEVDQVFESWDAMLEQSGIDESVFAEVFERVLEAHREVAARAEELESRARRLEDEAKKVPELKRFADAAKAKREEADARAMDAEARSDAVGRELEGLATTAARLERELTGLRDAAAAAMPADTPRAEEEVLEEMERTLAAHAATQVQRDDLHERIERLRGEREQDRRTIAELTRTLASIDAVTGNATAVTVEEEPPVTMLEAVERAAREALHLRFAPRAFETAADSPFRRPGLVLRTLRALDDIAGRYAGGDMGRSLGQAAAEHGITQWRPDVAETTRKRYEDDYSFPYEGRKLWVGPHIGLGSGSGAGFVARIYLHVLDGSDPALARGIVVASVGRHLPDTTT